MAETKSKARVAAEAKATAVREQRVGKGKTAAELSAFQNEVSTRQNQLNDLRTQIAGTSGQRTDLQSQIDAIQSEASKIQGHGTGASRAEAQAAMQQEFLKNSNLSSLQDQLQRLGTGDAGLQAQLQTGEQSLVDFRQGFNANPNSMSQKLQNAGFGGTDRERDLLAGTKLGETILGDRGLGRLQEDADIQESLGRFKDIADNGLSSQEVEAERTQLFQGADRNNQTALRGLQARLAASGVRGATAGNKLAQTALQGAAEKSNIERDLFLKSAETKRQGLVDFSERLGATKTFDLAQEAREKDIVLQAGLGQAQLGVSERAASDAAAAQERAAAARSSASCFLPEMNVDMNDGSVKQVSELELGDETTCGIVTGVSKHIMSDKLYSYKGVFVTGKHIVFDRGSFKKVEDTDAVESFSRSKIVHNVWTSTGMIEIQGILFSDYEGFSENQEEYNDKACEDMNEAYARLLQRSVQLQGNH